MLRERSESLDSIVYRDAVAADIPALAELHVTTWNATYNATRGPTIETRTSQLNAQRFGGPAGCFWHAGGCSIV